MKTKLSLIFSVALFVVLVVFLITDLSYSFKAAIFPLITISIALILLVSLILPHEIRLLRQKEESAEAKEPEVTVGKHLAVITWLIVTPLMLWLLGFLATVLLLPFLYLRCSGEKWALSIGLPLVCVIFFYGVFSVLLETPLYEGYLVTLIFD